MLLLCFAEGEERGYVPGMHTREDTERLGGFGWHCVMREEVQRLGSQLVIRQNLLEDPCRSLFTTQSQRGLVLAAGSFPIELLKVM